MSIYLHLGCGPRLIEGWMNVDIAPGEGATQGDATNLHFIEDGSVSRIYCEDMFEHFDQQQQLKFLSECNRVLRPQGMLRISCPELISSLLREDDPWAWGHFLIPTRNYLTGIAEWSEFEIAYGDRNDAMDYGFPEDLRPFLPDTSQRERQLAALGHIFALLVKK